MRAAPAVSCAKLCEETHTSIQVQREQSGIPCAMALRLMPRSPRRRIPLVTVIDGLAALSRPVGLTKTSADLTPATGAKTTRFCRTQPPAPNASTGLVPVRRSFSEGGFGAVRLARDGRSRETRPAISFAPDAAASTASHPNVRDDGRRPSSGMRRRELCR
jgi:hypothetical protein